MITQEQFEKLLPLACQWAEEQERVILQRGVMLTGSLAQARDVGVAHPEQVRLLRVDAIPIPEHPELAVAAVATGLISATTAGLTLRYGIFIRSDCWGQGRLVKHELVHTSQYERLGGFKPFLKAYLGECLTIGYPNGPLEMEARRAVGEA